jgi:hypothetical protein
MDQEDVVIKRPLRRRRNSKLTDSFFIKYGLKILLGIVIVIIFLTLVQCSVKKPVSPTWTTSLVLPVINRTYDMDEIVNKINQPGLSLETNDEIYFTFEETLDTVRIDEDFGVDDITDTLTDSLGLVTLQPSTAPSQTFTATQFGYSSNVPLIPKGWLNMVSIDLPQFDIFDWMTISTGDMDIEFINELGFDLDSIFIILNDNDSNRIINITQVIGDPAVSDGDTANLTIDLSGKTISNNLSVSLNCYTPGYEDWWYVAGKKATVTPGFESELTVSAAEAEIPPVAPIDMSESIILNSEHTILSADLTSGTLQVMIENYSNLSADLSMSLPDFVDGALPFLLDTTIAPQSITTILVDMATYDFEPSDIVLPQEIDLDATLTISGSSEKVAVSRGDMFRVIAGLSNIQFDSMDAILQPIEMSFDNLDTVELDIPRGFDELQLSRATLTLDIESAVSFPCLLELTISGDAGQTPIVISQTIAGGTSANPVTTTITDSSLASFLNPVPHYITISGQATLGGDGIGRTITRNDYLYAGFNITSPLEVIVDSLTISGDTTSEEIDQEDIDGIVDHFISADFDATVDNSLPLSVILQIYFDGDSTNLNENAQVIKTLQVDEDTVSHVSFSLDSNEIKILENDPLYITQEITFVGDGSSPVEIFRSDRVIIQGTINVEYKFDGEF